MKITNLLYVPGRGCILVCVLEKEETVRFGDIVFYMGKEFEVKGIEQMRGLLSPPIRLNPVGLLVKEVKRMNFGQAIEALKEGKRVYRTGWNGVGMWLELQRPDAHSKMTHPYIYIEYPVNPQHHAYPNGSRIPWLASQADVLAEDWNIM